MSYLSKAKEVIIQTVSELTAALKYLDALSNFGSTVINRPNRDKFFQGISLLYEALHASYVESLSRSMYFIWSGKGDDPLVKLSKKIALKRFSKEDRYEIMDFLTTWGHLPGVYYTEDKEKFRNEVLEELNKESSNEV